MRREKEDRARLYLRIWHLTKVIKELKGGRNMKNSKAWRLNRADVERVVRNALIFLAPVAIVSLELIQQGKSFDEILIAIKVWGLGVALDALRKLQSGK